jgi:hypothetical protein
MQRRKVKLFANNKLEGSIKGNGNIPSLMHYSGMSGETGDNHENPYLRWSASGP